MIKTLFFLVFLTFSICPLLAQSISDALATRFVNTLINEPENVHQFLDIEDLYTSQRLGISYEASPAKFLLSYDFTNEQRIMLQSGTLDFRYEVLVLEGDFSKLNIQLNDESQTVKQFYFFRNSLISPISFFTKDWSTTESRYFKFYSKNTAYINTYSIQKLDQFVEKLIRLLDLSDEKIARLATEKIDYFFADSEQTIKALTGYASKGQYNLAYDAIVSTYNAHYHEVAHLLLNYKLEELPLYAHPLLQEGFAVAMGGRGGLAKMPLLSFASFALENGIIYPKLLSNPTDFLQTGASITYPVAGLLVSDFISEQGIEVFLMHYKAFSSGTREEIRTLPEDLFISPISAKKKYELIEVLSDSDTFSTLNSMASIGKNRILEDQDSYYFSLTDSVLITSDLELSQNYKSLKFLELFPTKTYSGEHLLINVNDSEIAVYDLYSNELITNYVIGFQNNPKPTRSNDGTFRFRLSKKVFPFVLKEILSISTLE